MTDVLKGIEGEDSAEVVKAVKGRTDILRAAAETLREEFRDLGAGKPEIIVFGGDATRLAKQVLTPDDYASLTRVTHYSHFIGPEKYRSEIQALA